MTSFASFKASGTVFELYLAENAWYKHILVESQKGINADQ